MKSESNSEKVGIRGNLDSDELILEFDTLSEDFQRGFECGEIWACLTDDVEEVQSIISAKNAEMVMRMAEATGYSFMGRELSQQEINAIKVGPGEWMVVVLRSNYVEQ